MLLKIRDDAHLSKAIQSLGLEGHIFRAERSFVVDGGLVRLLVHGQPPSELLDKSIDDFMRVIEAGRPPGASLDAMCVLVAEKKVQVLALGPIPTERGNIPGNECQGELCLRL